jgi:hypothetical protein
MYAHTNEVVLNNRDNKPMFRDEHLRRSVYIADGVSPSLEEHRGDVVGRG